LKNDVNVPSKRNKHKNLEKKKFLVFVGILKITAEKTGSGSGSTSQFASGSVSQRYGSEDPDPYQMSQIWNTGLLIRIQHFRLNTEPDPDPIWIQSFDDQKLNKTDS
jgi:hypothetical protein